jgi:AcrR family transcriptional regulator
MPSTRRDRGETTRQRGVALTRDDFVEAAMAEVKSSGVEGLTMRKLAERLGMTPMAAYHHVKSKEELLEAVGARVLQEAYAKEPPGSDETWEAHVRANAHSVFNALMPYPGLATFLLDRPIGRNLRTPRHRTVEMLEEAGLSTREAQMARATWHTYVFGLVSMEAQFRRRKRGAKRTSHDAILVDVDVDEFIDFGIDVLIEGIHAKLASVAPPRSRR